MMKNVTGMKKIISVMLLGSLLVTGAVVYADTLSSTGIDVNKDWAGAPKQMEQRGGREGAVLSQMVTAKIITAEEQATIEKAMAAQRTQMQADREALKGTEAVRPEKPDAGAKPVSHYARMAEDGLIPQALADKVDAYMTAQRDAAFAAEVKPLVDAKTFADTNAVKTAMDAVKNAMDAKMDALKPAVEREKVDFKSLTDAERATLKAEMGANRTAMQAKHDAAITEVYSGLVEAGTLTQAQADALQSLMNNHEPGERGHGPGHGGMERPSDSSVKTSEVAE